MKRLLPWILFPLMLMAQQDGAPVKSPQAIQQELESAEARLKRAKEMFAPYYTGPLVTPSPSMVPPGNVVVSSHLSVTDTYAAFDKDRHSVSLPNDKVQANLQPVILVIGVTDSVDSLIVWGAQGNWQRGHSGGGWDDVSAGLGFLIQKEKVYVPQFKFTIQQTFPTGKYENLQTNGLGLNGTGGGVYATQFGLAASKIIFWTTKHPVNLRLFSSYSLSTDVHVENFNSYGGGFGTRGTVHPGNNFSVDFAFEVSLTQKWVFANDFVYSATNDTKFHGVPGTTTPGGTVPAGVGSGYSDNFSLAPAIEYNWSDRLGVIGGVQFSVYGRNSGNFVSGIISWYGVY